MTHRKWTTKHAMLPHPYGLPERSLRDIVLCYIFYDPRFWGI